MKKIIIMIVSLLIFTFSGIQSSFAKDKLIILNAGSKTGGFAMQMTAMSKDLAPYYDIDLRIPGDYCTAVQMLKSIKGPVMMTWANDFEVAWRNGTGCATFDIKPSQVINYGQSVMMICSMNFDADSLMKNEHTVAHTTPVGPNSAAVLAINQSFGAKLKPIAYDGSGAAKAGLYNGEVDYIMTSAKHGNKVMQNGGQCFYEYSADKNSPFIPLANLDPNNKLLKLSMEEVWVGLNMTANETEKLRKLVKTIANDSSSAISKYISNVRSPKYLFDLTDDEITENWENAVTSWLQ